MGISTYTPPAERLLHETAVDFKAGTRTAAPVHLMQYDMTLPILAVSLYSDGVPYTLPANASASIRVGKVDGTVVYNPALGCNATRTVVYCEMTKQITAQYGIMNAILEIALNGMTAGSSYIQLDIARNPVQDGSAVSSDEFLIMAELVAEAEEVVGNPPKIQNGYWWMWNSTKKAYANTGTPASGTKGDNGVTPTIGANGNWYLGSTDTGKPSRGADGTTPVRGVDYYTTADKTAIVNDVLSQLNSGDSLAYGT